MTIKGEPGQQLRMFMTARELHDGTGATPGDGGADVWKTKQADNSRRPMTLGKRPKPFGVPLAEAVAAEGVKHPVSLLHQTNRSVPLINDGHHRVQAAYDHDPESYVPVEHRLWSRPWS